MFYKRMAKFTVQPSTKLTLWTTTISFTSFKFCRVTPTRALTTFLHDGEELALQDSHQISGPGMRCGPSESIKVSTEKRRWKVITDKLSWTMKMRMKRRKKRRQTRMMMEKRKRKKSQNCPNQCKVWLSLFLTSTWWTNKWYKSVTMLTRCHWVSSARTI